MANGSQNPLQTVPANLPESRSIPKMFKSLGCAIFWFLWDSFWKIFNLESAGDEVREHSPNLNKKRAGVLLTLMIIAYLSGCAVWHFQAGKLSESNETIRQLRAYNAGRPHTESPAELMGFHEQTNYIAVTNTTPVTNLIVHISTLTNTVVFFASRPVLDLFQMETIRDKLKTVPHFPISILWREDDDGAVALSKQVWQIFSIEGFDVKTSVLPKTFQTLQNAVSIVSSPKANPKPIANAINQLGTFLGHSTLWDVELGIPDTNVLIIITTINK